MYSFSRSNKHSEIAVCTISRTYFVEIEYFIQILRYTMFYSVFECLRTVSGTNIKLSILVQHQR